MEIFNYISIKFEEKKNNINKTFALYTMCRFKGQVEPSQKTERERKLRHRVCAK